MVETSMSDDAELLSTVNVLAALAFPFFRLFIPGSVWALDLEALSDPLFGLGSFGFPDTAPSF